MGVTCLRPYAAGTDFGTLPVTPKGIQRLRKECYNTRILFGLYLEEEFSALFHDLLDLQEAGRVHEEELVAHRHAEAARVAESQYLLEALGLHSRWELHDGWAHLIAARVPATAAEKVPEVRAAGSQDCSMSLRENQINSNPRSAFSKNLDRFLQTQSNFLFFLT